MLSPVEAKTETDSSESCGFALMRYVEATGSCDIQHQWLSAVAMWWRFAGIVAVLSVSSSSIAGCGLALTGSRSIVPIDSYPQGAEVWVDGVKIGKTPLVYEAEAAKSQSVVLRGMGHEKTVRLEKRLNGEFILFDVLLGVVPLIIDGMTGGWYTLAPRSLRIEMQSEASTAMSPPPRARVQ